MKTALVRDVMTRRVQTARPDDDLEVALQRMLWAGIRHLPVILPDGAVAGVVSQRDIFERMALATDALSMGHTSARQLVSGAMRVPAETIGPDETIGVAARRMAEQRLGCMPVTEQGALVGIVTTTDLLAELGMNEALREITASPDVSSVMTRDPVTVLATDKVSVAITRMVDNRIRHLPVVDEDSRLVGILSDRDVRAAIGDPRFHAGDPRAAHRTVEQIMTPRPITLRPYEPIGEVVSRFVDERVGAIPVIAPDGAVVGIVSYLDVLRFVRGSRVWGEA